MREQTGRLSVEELRSFLALVKHRHFEKAADELHISQPAVSRQLKNLENELGTDLVIRRPGRRRTLDLNQNHVLLTAAGEELRIRAERIVKEAEEARIVIRALRHVHDDALRVALTPGNHHFAVSSVAAMMRTIRDERVVLAEERDPDKIVLGIMEGRFDLGVAIGATRSDPSLTSQRLSRAPWKLIVNKQHPIAKTEGPRDIATLTRERFVFPVRPATERILIEHYFLGQRFNPKLALETDTADAVLAYVRACPTVMTILPAAQTSDRRDLAFLELAEPPDQPMVTELLWRGEEPRKESGRRLAAAFRAYFDDSARDAPHSPSWTAGAR